MLMSESDTIIKNS